MSLAVGNIVEGVVTGITKFGAFVELPGGITGLIHISEVADTYVKDVNEFLKEKQQVKVKVINIDPSGKIGLSIKQLTSGPKKRDMARGRKPREKDLSFEDKLARFLKESDERHQDIKRNTESKRGGRGIGRT